MFFNLVFAVVAIFLPLIAVIKAEIFTSTFELEKMIQKQSLFLREELHGKRKDKLDRNNFCYSDLFLRSTQPAKTMAEHPILAFQFIKCHLQLNHSVFSEQDLKGAAMSIVRLQDTYDLNIPDILEGKIMHFHSNVNLTVRDCLLIAKQAFFNLQLESATNWMAHCLQLRNSLTREQMMANTPNQSDIEEFQRSVAWIKDLIEGKRSPDVLRSILQIFPEFSEAALQIITEDKPAAELKKQLLNNARNLCQGLLPFSQQKSHHRCFYKRHRLSYTPFLVEMLHNDPEIILYHKVVSNREIIYLKKEAFPKLETTKTHRSDDLQIQSNAGRIGKMAWLSKYNYKIVQEINQRVEIITGLTTESAEDLQVLNYGIGGHYEIHVDFFDSTRKNLHLPTGDRTATVLFYINNVQYGGITVFPEIGISVVPTKGSALVWYNLHKDGTGDYRTLHAACPVIIGSKWVANVWLHEKGQHQYHFTPA